MRNFAVGVVPLALAMAFGANEIGGWARRATFTAVGTRWVRPVALGAVMLALVAAQVLAGRCYTSGQLRVDAIAQMKRIGEPELNDFLYRELPRLPTGARVGTGYQLLSRLPGLEERYSLVNCSSAAEMRAGWANGDVRHYLWLPERCDADVNSRLGALVKSGAMRSLGGIADRQLLEIVSPAEFEASLRATPRP